MVAVVKYKRYIVWGSILGISTILFIVLILPYLNQSLHKKVTSETNTVMETASAGNNRYAQGVEAVGADTQVVDEKASKEDEIEAAKVDTVKASKLEANEAKVSEASIIKDNSLLPAISPGGNWKVSYVERGNPYDSLIRFEHISTKEIYYTWATEIAELLWNRDETKVAISYYPNEGQVDYYIMELEPNSYINMRDPFLYSGYFRNGIKWDQGFKCQPVAWKNSSSLKVEFECYDLQGDQYQGSYLFDTDQDTIKEHQFTDYPKKGLAFIDKLGDQLAVNWELYEKQEYPLLAESPDKAIQLYDVKNTVNNLLLRKGDLIQAFPWNALSPLYILPRIYEADIDKDGLEELICILHTGTGTGVAIEDLIILEPREDGYYYDVMFQSEDYVAQLKSLITWEYDNKNHQIIIAVGKNTIKVPDELPDYTFEELSWGSIIGFSYEEADNCLVMNFCTLGSYKEIAAPVYLVDMKAKLIYNGEEFWITKPVITDIE